MQINDGNCHAHGDSSNAIRAEHGKPTINKFDRRTKQTPFVIGRAFMSGETPTHLCCTRHPWCAARVAPTWSRSKKARRW